MLVLFRKNIQELKNVPYFSTPDNTSFPNYNHNLGRLAIDEVLNDNKRNYFSPILRERIDIIFHGELGIDIKDKLHKMVYSIGLFI